MDATLPRFDYLQRLWRMRFFCFSLVQNDLSQRYRRSFLGIGWSLVRPLAMTFILCTIFGKLFKYDIAEYAPYLLTGMTLWQFFTEALLNGGLSFNGGKAYIRQQQVPLAIFPLRAVLGSGFHALMALSMAILFTLYFRGGIAPMAFVYLLPAMLILFLLGWCLAIVSGVMFVHFPDTFHLLEIGLQLLFYLTPIMYKVRDMGERARITRLLEWNPLTSVLQLFRTPLLEGQMPSAHDLGVSLLFLGIAATLAIVLLRKLERTLVFWI